MYRMRCTRSGKRLVTWIGAFLLISLVWCQVYWSQERSLASRQSENIKRATKQKVANNIYKSFNAELPKTRLNINPELRQKFVSRLYNGRIQQEKLTKNGNSWKSNFDDDNSESTRNIWETDTTKSRNNDLFNNEKAAEINEDGTVYNETAFMKVLHKQKSGVTKSPIRDFKQVRIKVYDESGMHVLKYEEYKKWKYQSFVRDVANPFPKSKTPPKVVPYDNDIPRPNPGMLIKDLSTEIDDFGIQIETGKDKARRLRLGDDDILK
uniref:Uncharacterized protein n=1 Tax=Ciona savignyi TaxID=51511 RepID=H2Y6Z3_CIOSA